MIFVKFHVASMQSISMMRRHIDRNSANCRLNSEALELGSELNETFDWISSETISIYNMVKINDQITDSSR